MPQSVCTFPPGTWLLVLKNLLSFRIPKTPPPAAPGSSIPTTSLKIQVRVGTSSPLKHTATPEANTVRFCRQAQEFNAKSQLPSHKTEVLERDPLTGRAVLHWRGSPGRINLAGLIAELSRHKWNAEFGGEASRLVKHFFGIFVKHDRWFPPFLSKGKHYFT